MTISTPTRVHHTVGNDLGGTQRPSGELGWGGFVGAGSDRGDITTFQQLSPTMGEAEQATNGKHGIGGSFHQAKGASSVIKRNQRTGTIAKQVGGLFIASEPVLSKSIGNVVFSRMEPGGSVY